jgi:hypothetical protein
MFLRGGDPPTNRKRLATLLLVAGAAAAGFVFMPAMPHEHRVDLRLDHASTVTGVEVAWSPAADDGRESRVAEALQGGSWRFEPGKAPRTVASHVRLPDGRYELDAVVERGSGRDAFHRTITFGEADHITVPLVAPRAQAEDKGSP